jgi:hypothetical protein
VNFKFHPDAEDELAQAIDYFESCRPGMGLEFLIEVEAAIARILSYPRAWPVLEDSIRRCRTKRFPFGIVYSEEKNGYRGGSVSWATRWCHVAMEAVKNHGTLPEIPRAPSSVDWFDELAPGYLVNPLPP